MANIKGACFGMLVGLVALALSPWAILTNEANAVCTGQAYDDAEAQVEERGCSYVAEHDGAFVHIACAVVRGGHLAVLATGSGTSLRTEGFVLIATTEMWQWKESSHWYPVNGDPDDPNGEWKQCWCYERGWSPTEEVLTPAWERGDICAECPNPTSYPSWLDSNPAPPGGSSFAGGCQGGAGMCLGTLTARAGQLPLGESSTGSVEFTLSSGQINKLAGWTPTAFAAWAPAGARAFPIYGGMSIFDGWRAVSGRPGEWIASAAAYGYGYGYGGGDGYYADDANPTIGDLRLKAVAFGTDYVSAVGKQKRDGGLARFKAGGSDTPKCDPRKVLYVEASTKGYASAKSLFKKLRRKLSDGVIAGRVFTWLLVFVALLLIAGPVKAVPEALPVVGGFLGEIVGAVLFCMSLTLSVSIWLFVTAICWVAYHPLYGGLMFGGAAVCLCVVCGIGVAARGNGRPGAGAGYQLQLS